MIKMNNHNIIISGDNFTSNYDLETNEIIWRSDKVESKIIYGANLENYLSGFLTREFSEEGTERIFNHVKIGRASERSSKNGYTVKTGIKFDRDLNAK